MQKSDRNNTAKVVRRKMVSSTTINRKYVKRPVHIASSKQESSSEAMEQNNSGMMNEAMNETHPIQQTVNSRMKKRCGKVSTAQAGSESRLTAKELKEQAIKKALAETVVETDKVAEKKNRKKSANKMHFGFGRVLLALSCAAVAVFAIVYFVNLNMPDISLRVAAMQTGIDASYPSYVPRDYNTSSITYEEGKITIEFRNAETDTSFTLVEETSSWDSSALLANYVKDEFGENYTTVREQGLTIYISGSNAAWVNKGIVYKIKASAGVLTNKQIKSIAVSL